MTYKTMNRIQLIKRCIRLQNVIDTYESGDGRLLLLDAAIKRAKEAGADNAVVINIILNWTRTACTGKGFGQSVEGEGA